MYSFSMIVFQLFEHAPPFAGMDPVEAARQASLQDRRPKFVKLIARDKTTQVILAAGALVSCTDRDNKGRQGRRPRGAQGMPSASVTTSVQWWFGVGSENGFRISPTCRAARPRF